VKSGSSLGKNGFAVKKEDFPVLFRDKPLLHHETAVQDTVMTKHCKIKIKKKKGNKNNPKAPTAPEGQTKGHI